MFTEKQLRRQPSETQTELMNRMLGEAGSNKYRAVSFRMEDVLVMTPFLDEYALFMFMEEDFAMFDTKGKKTFTELRIAAAEAAEKKYGVRTRVTLAKIYDIFAKLSGVSPDGRDKLMERECELIEHFTFPRECGKALYREAKNSRKRVIIFSESIYPREVVEEILERCGYSSYDGLVVISEIKDCDARSWYNPVLEKAGVSAAKLFHCGHDVAYDIELAIMNGSKAMMTAPAVGLMERSGRLAGYIRDKLVYDLDSPEHLALQCFLGSYAAYGFDIPQTKVPLSDICGDGRLLGFIVLGAYSLCGEDYKPSSRQALIINALNSDKAALEGKEDFDTLFSRHFGSFLDKFGSKDCELPLQFVEECCSAADREFFRPYMSPEALKKWGSSVKEPKLVEYSTRSTEKRALDRLADKMFPPGTKVRNITDGILSKGRKKNKK
ncbi:MAG: hypothetical protein IJK31_06280 [Ruminococcus sp.]|nr:hypothetical protein [Ruminococcus sp.]